MFFKQANVMSVVMQALDVLRNHDRAIEAAKKKAYAEGYAAAKRQEFKNRIEKHGVQDATVIRVH